MSSLPRTAAARRHHASGAAAPGGAPSAGAAPGDIMPPLTAQQQQALRQQMMMQQQARAAQPRFTFAATNRRVRDRNQNVLTPQEMQEMMEKDRQDDPAYQARNRNFRFYFSIIMLCIVGLLLYMKYDVEANVEIPLMIHDGKSGSVFESPYSSSSSSSSTASDAAAASEGEDATAAASSGKNADTTAASRSELADMYALFGVKAPSRRPAPAASSSSTAAKPEATKDKVDSDGDGKTAPATPAADDATTSGGDAVFEQRLADEERQRLLDSYRKKKEVKKAYEQHQSEMSALVACGRNCEAHHQKLEVAHNTISSKVEFELYGMLLDDVAKEQRKASKGEKVRSPNRRISDEELAENYQKKKELIETTEKDEEFKEMQLAELKDAYEILVNPDARRYYHLYGAKPPEMMKKMSARDGGWGQGLLLRTFKTRLILSWLSYLDSAYADYGVLIAIGMIGFLLPALMQLPRVIEMANEIERRQNEMDELERREQGLS